MMKGCSGSSLQIAWLLLLACAGFAFGADGFGDDSARPSGGHSESSFSPSPALSAFSALLGEPEASACPRAAFEEFVTGVDGKLKQIKDRSGTRDLIWNFDKLDLATYAGPGVLSGYQLDPQFDDQGRRTGVVLRKGGSVVHQVTFARGDPDAPHSRQLTGANTSWMNATYRRDPVNHWITSVDRGGADLVFQRDGKRAGRLVRAESTVAEAPSFKYQRFDALGRRTYVRRSQGDWSYRYHNGHLVSAWNSSGPDFSYDVDAIGRRRNFRNNGGMSPGDASAWTLNQPAGNRESAPGWHDRFDGRNRLVGAETEDYASNPTGTRLSFEYDSDGRRVQMTVTPKTTSYDGQITETTLTTHFVWDGWQLLYECQQDDDGNITLERRYVWGADLSGGIGGAGGVGGLLAYQEQRNGNAPEVFYPLYDDRGNVVGLADESNTLVAEYQYGPFGELISATGPKALKKTWRFATKYHDLETNLTYFGFRYCAPSEAWHLLRGESPRRKFLKGGNREEQGLATRFVASLAGVKERRKRMNDTTEA